MKKINLSLMMITTSGLLHGQSFPAEVMIGHNYAMYQHTLQKSFGPENRYGVVHIANILGWYKQPGQKSGMPNEVMNQGYLRYSIHKNFAVMLGYFYANVPNLSGSFAMQFHLKREKWLFALSPRFDIMEKGAYEMFGMFEYRPFAGRKVQLYTRLQAMTSRGPYHHNRSYQRLRLGVDVKKIQFGFALNTDFYGQAPLVKTNAGIFLRKELH